MSAAYHISGFFETRGSFGQVGAAHLFIALLAEWFVIRQGGGMNEPLAIFENMQLFDAALSLWRQFELFVMSLIRPANFVQIGVIIGLLLVAHLLSMFLGPRFQDWVRSREGLSKGQLRWLVVVRQRLRGLIFLPLIWLGYGVMQQIYSFPSRYYVIGIAASLATAWLVVAFATRVIRNTFVRKVVSWGAWIWVTLSIVGVTTQAQTLLDSAALSVGETRISVWLIVQAVVILGALLTLARLITQTTAERLNRNEDVSPSMRVLAVKAMQVVFYGAAFFFGMNALGVDLTGLAVLSGAIGVGLGFGLQKVVSNLVSGVIILLDKSIKPGDVISLGETFGWIQTLGARYASVVTRDGKEYLIPNEDLITGQVVNWSHSNDYVRLDIHFGTAYGDDPHRVRELAIEAAQTVDRVLSYPKTPVCHIVGFGDSSVDYILRFWISDPTGGLTNIRGGVFLALWDTFKEHGISIPFPQREVKLLEDGVSAETGLTD